MCCSADLFMAEVKISLSRYIPCVDFFSISFMSQYIKDIKIKIKTFSKTGLIIHARQTFTTNAGQTDRYIEIYIYNWQLVRKLNK